MGIGCMKWIRHLVPVFVLVTFVGGCGDGRPPRVQVTGRVLIDNQPLTLGTIQVAPANARPAYGRIGPDGRFTLSSFGDHDGVVKGTHQVAVLATEDLDSRRCKWHAPKKYSQFDTSGLSVTIDGPTDDLLIELTWAGGAPFVETVGSGE